MSTIYKFALNMDLANCGHNHRPLWDMRLEKVLHAGLDPQGVPCVWAKVYPCKGIHDKLTLTIVGTGQPLGNAATTNHVGSFVQGPYVWHVFTT